MKKLITTVFLISLVSVSYGQDANNADEQEIVFQPAIFGEFKEQFISKINIPSDYNDFSIIVLCSGPISANGRFARRKQGMRRTQAICSQKNGSEGLEGRSVDRIVERISEASRNLQVEPASVNGINKSIRFYYHVNINKTDGSLGITINENHLVNANLLGTDYIASQRFDPLGVFFMGRLSKCFSTNRPDLTIGAVISSTGSALDYNIVDLDDPSRSCIISVERLIEESEFIPAFVDAQPVASVWSEVFYTGQGLPGEFWTNPQDLNSL